MREALKVGISGVRGIVGDSMTPRVALSFAQAFGAFVGRGTVLVGRDTRPSGRVLERAVVAGLESVGCRPLLAGVAPTPSLLMAVPTLGARGGIAITASHNAAEWNALKFIDRDGHFLSPARADELLDLYHQRDFPLAAESDLPAETPAPDVTASHRARVAAWVAASAIRARRFRVAADVCNGVGALSTEPFLREELGCDVVVVHGDPSGFFERDPEPLPQHLGALSRAVVEHRCDIGFAQDPDGDRLAIVDERGVPIGEDYTLAFAVRRVLESRGVGPVVINLATSRAVEEIARAHGAPVIRTKIGEIHVALEMQRRGAVVGGEHNGGVILPAIHLCRDSFTAMALALELMAATGRPVSALRAEMPSYQVVRRKLPTTAASAAEALRGLRRRYADRSPNLLDGVFIEFPEGWVHARRSNTEPVLRITAEARTEVEAAALADRIASDVAEAAAAKA